MNIKVIDGLLKALLKSSEFRENPEMDDPELSRTGMCGKCND